jgi:hypothetical protein
MTSRQDIAAVLTIAGVTTGNLYKPSILAAGVAWPQIASLDLVEGFFATTWAVYVVLPAGDKAASIWWDQHVREVLAALAPVIYVERIEPVLIVGGAVATDGIYAMLLTGRSE